MLTQKISLQTKLIFKSLADKNAVFAVLRLSRSLFNFCSKRHFGAAQHGLMGLHEKCYYAAKSEFPEAKSQLIVKAEQAVVAAYRSIKANKRQHQLITPPIKKRLSLQLDQRIMSVKQVDGKIDSFSIVGLDKRLRVKFSRYANLEQMLQYKICNSTIFARNGDVYINLIFDVPTPIAMKSNLALGVDLGVRRFAATSNGHVFIDKQYNADHRKLRYLKRCLNRTIALGSKSAKRHLNSLREKERNISRNLCHNLSKAVVKLAVKDNAGTIVLENLNVRKLKAKKSKYQSKNRISQVAFAGLRRMITYKAALLGRAVVCVNPAYTSQIDCRTGLLGDRRGCRFYANSGLIYDADINAAINIAKLANLPVSCGNVLDGQAVVNQPIARDHAPANFRL